MSKIYDSLIEYNKSNAYPFHMPGHKRHLCGDVLDEISQIDITEIDGFDNLHDAKGIIKEAQIRAARLYGAEESYFLINGSTCGILSAIAACVPNGGWLMMGRNCHKAVYHAALLGGLKTFYVYPQIEEGYSFCDGLHLDEIRDSVNKFYKLYPAEKISAVIITSPTYEGMLSEVQEIAAFLHEKRIPLIIDEAHGAHLGLAKQIPQNSCVLGADLVIHSLHKTLPAMTQTALLHVNGTLVDRQRLRRYLSIYQTSSPSYVLMASIDRALTIMEENGEDYFKLFLERKKKLLQTLQDCKIIRVYQGGYTDPCKLLLSTKGSLWTGKTLYDKLRLEYNLQMEMAAGDYVVAILTVMDSEEGFVRLQKAILELDDELDKEMTDSKNKVHSCQNVERREKPSMLFKAEPEYTIAEALDRPHEEVPYMQAEGRVSADFVYLYPPGVPLLAPGEIITDDHICYLQKVQEQKLDLKGLKSNRISVLKN